MKYGKMPRAMWLLFRGSFARAAKRELHVENGRSLMRAAHKDYREILSGVDEFDPDSRFAVNIMSCAMVIAVLKNLKKKPTLDEMTAFYKAGMCENVFMKAFLKKGRNYTPEGQEKLRLDAEKSLKRTNPYDWKFTYTPGETLNQYTATFTTCGICVLMKEYGFFEYVPAMCRLDYDMAEMGGSVFTREYTLASGGPYCDCHYDHKEI
ncbi:MAG: L-2-amino-thiazoline-4-carboxylic acid hydrolase [Lachnospiraceae bacterium]|nr:L-2-amino-thiazoline-4-carboxylic acid hydrolase [Lachnospiraceae bacterium]